MLTDRGIVQPTPIQSATLPDALAGRDVLGRGRTGSGKTYGFLLPLVARLTASRTSAKPNRPRALVLAPTRELAGQIAAALTPLAAVSGLTSVTIFGGVSQQPQVRALKAGVDVVIACPGRLEDLVKQGYCRLDQIEITVLDEADHMADLGFLPPVRRLLTLTPKTGQRMMFSATLDGGIDTLVRAFLHQPVTHQADAAEGPTVEMAHHVLHVRTEHRLPVLTDLTSAPGRTVVFTRTKHRAKTLAKQLNASGVPAVALHGDLSQNARTRSMDAFHAGSVQTLVATDIAARGIHVDDVELVVHADPPAEHKAYTHRSGRTARAGKAGTVDHLDDRRPGLRRPGADPGRGRPAHHHPGGVDDRSDSHRTGSGPPFALGGADRRRRRLRHGIAFGRSVRCAAVAARAAKRAAAPVPSASRPLAVSRSRSAGSSSRSAGSSSPRSPTAHRAAANPATARPASVAAAAPADPPSGQRERSLAVLRFRRWPDRNARPDRGWRPRRAASGGSTR